MQSGDHKRHVHLFARAFAPEGAETQQSSVVERLADLDEADVIDSYAVEVWGKRVSRPATTDGFRYERPALTRLSEFEEWAERTDHTLEPFFRERERHSQFTDETHRVVVVPVMCLAVYEDNDLRGVFPCADDERTYSVYDYLDALESRGSSDPEPTVSLT